MWGRMIHMELHDQTGHRSRQTIAQCDPIWDNPCPDLQDSSAQSQVQVCRVHEGSPVGAELYQLPALALTDSIAAATKFEY